MSKRSSLSSSSESETKVGKPPPYNTGQTDDEKTVARMDSEDPNKEKKLKYPRSVFFIVVNEFCERFSYYGMRTILSLYLNKALGFPEDTATVLYHVFIMLCYFTPILGAIVADTFLGKYKTILYVSILYAVGNVVLSVGAIPNTEWIGAPVEDAYGVPQTVVSLIGLFIIAVGTGGIKPCVAAFGGDQFIRPQQDRQLETFFSIFYFSINAGSLLSTVVTPILRDEVECAGVETCYPLAFGVPAILFAVALAVFVAGKSLYIIKPPEGNVIVDTMKCMGHAISRKFKAKKGEKKRDHWLDYADDKYDTSLIQDLKGVLTIVLLYLPMPFFWALFDQQGSRWTFQATRMDGNLGGGVAIKPDQMQVVNPLLILLFVPIFEAFFYPLFNKIGVLHRPLQKMVFGGTLAGVAFVVSGLVELQLEPTYAKIPPTNSLQLNIYNTLDCNLTINFNNTQYEVPRLSALPLDDSSEYFKNGVYDLVATSMNCPDLVNDTLMKTLNMTQYPSASLLFSYSSDSQGFDALDLAEIELEKSDNANPRIRILYDLATESNGENVTFMIGGFEWTGLPDQGSTESMDRLSPGSYEIKYSIGGGDPVLIRSEEFLTGAVYEVVVASDNPGEPFMLVQELTKPNSVSILLLIPQYVLITMGEVMFSPIGLQFSFTQAPESMKSLIQGLWQLTVAFGNLIVIIIAEAKIFPKQSDEFFLFAGLMFVDMIILAILAWRYKYKETPDSSNKEKKKSISDSSDSESIGDEGREQDTGM
ncbi:solute carrier family 15 member 2-like isoform X2 [Artemia franciscana]